jgi:hypothetical protein
MRYFRHGSTIARSRWPEADSIRKLAGTHIPRYEPEDVRYFPRAEFGLPIVFQFKQDALPLPIPNRDPEEHILEWDLVGASRMASPFILKPLALSRDTAIPMVALLGMERITDIKNRVEAATGQNNVHLRLRSGTRTDAIIAMPRDVYDRNKAMNVQPLRERQTIDPRLAFLKYVRARWGDDCSFGGL